VKVVVLDQKIPLLEKKMEEKPEFAEYKRKTSMFIPMFKKVYIDTMTTVNMYNTFLPYSKNTNAYLCKLCTYKFITKNN
jgi:thiamine biosynthesis protein ThiC